MKLVIALIASAFLISSCSLQQNPLDGAADEVVNGNLPDTNKPIAEKPLDKMNLQIDAPSLVNAAVGLPVKFNIAGRVMVPGVEFVLYLDNIDGFPGATFDPVTGDFTWTPTKESIGTQVSTQLNLSVTIATVVAPGRVSTSENKVITIVLVNSFDKPTIKSVKGEATVIGGLSYTYTFEMTDKDATGKDAVNIIGQPCGTSGRSLTAYFNLVRYTVKDLGNGDYKGELTMDLYNATNLTAGSYCVGLAAVSPQGKVSDIYKWYIEYDPKIQRALSTLSTKPIVLTQGDVQKLNFSIYDPAGMGTMSVVKVEDLSLNLPGSTISCVVDSSNKSLIYCDALLDARTANVGSYRSKIDVVTTSNKTKQNTSSTHNVNVIVKAAL